MPLGNSDPKGSAPNTIISPEKQSIDYPADKALRPQCLKEYVGQSALKAQLSVYLQACRERQDALDHVLLFGPPGLGKTTLAQIIATELQVDIKTTSGPALEKPGDIAAILVQLKPREVLFIDEIHRLPLIVEELLYSAMEDYKLDIVIGEGKEAHTHTLPISPFTLIGATTRAGALSSPLRDRFGITGRMEYYTQEELATILRRSSQLLGYEMDLDSALSLSKRSRGTPRIANRLVRRVRDFAQIENAGEKVITIKNIDHALQAQGVDQEGLDGLDRMLLWVLATYYNGGPVGIDTLSVAMGEAKDTLEESVEPYLIQQGYLSRTARGRMLTDKGAAVVKSRLP